MFFLVKVPFSSEIEISNISLAIFSPQKNYFFLTLTPTNINAYFGCTQKKLAPVWARIFWKKNYFAKFWPKCRFRTVLFHFFPYSWEWLSNMVSIKFKKFCSCMFFFTQKKYLQCRGHAILEKKNYLAIFLPKPIFQTLVFCTFFVLQILVFLIVFLNTLKKSSMRTFWFYKKNHLPSVAPTHTFWKTNLHFLSQFEFSNVSFFQFFSYFRDLIFFFKFHPDQLK